MISANASKPQPAHGKDFSTIFPAVVKTTDAISFHSFLPRSAMEPPCTYLPVYVNLVQIIGHKMEIGNDIIVRMALDAAKQRSKTWLALSRDLGVGRTTVYSWKYGKFYPSCEQFLNLLCYIDATEQLLEAIQKSSDAAAIIRTVCGKRPRKDDVRE